MRRNTDRRGFALAIAMFAIVVIGALIAGAFFSSTQEYRIGRNLITQTRAMAAAEHGLTHAVSAGWPADLNSTLRNGQVQHATYDNLGGQTGVSARVAFTRLNRLTYWVTSSGSVAGQAGTDAARRVGGVMRLTVPTMNFLGALTTRGTTQIGGSSHINGNDQNPPGWNCPAAGAAKPGIAIDDPTKITTSGCSNLNCVEGDPKVLQTAAAGNDSTYFEYGSTDWDELVAMATKRYSGNTNLQNLGPTSSGGTCSRQASSNWGEPRRNVPAHACEPYYPIIYVNGNLTLNTGRGQGILLVEGDLLVQGGFEFFGPVIVKGKLQTAGTGGHFNGGVMAANVELETNTVLGNAVVNYSRCALLTVLANTSTPKFESERAWVELF